MVNFLGVLIQNEKVSETKPPFKGQLKLSIEYRKDVLHVMICHAKDLAIPDGSKDEPNSYVKVYLRPDPHKATKRKTRVVRKNRHPSFMEMVSSRGMYIVHNELNEVVVFSVLNHLMVYKFSLYIYRIKKITLKVTIYDI